MNPPPDTRLPGFLRALRGPDFRLYFYGQAVSLLGTWTQQVAMVWLVYRLTGSSALLGVTTFVGLAPQLVLGPLAGAWADRQDKRTWLIRVQCLMAAQAVLLAVLTWTGLATPAFLVVMSLALGLLRCYDGPLRHTLISAYVAAPEDLPNALALNAMLVNGGRFVGPPVAGLLVGLAGEGTCFALNGLSFAALILALLRARGSTHPQVQGSTGQVFREGLRYLRRTPSARLLITVLVAVNLTASSYATLLPVLARARFAGDAATLGALWGAAGAGAVLGTLLLARLHRLARIARLLLLATVLAGLALAAVGLAGRPVLAAAALLVLGLALTLCNAGANILLQAEAPLALRGRVVAFFMSTRFGFDAIGGLLAGLLAERLAVRATFVAEAVLMTLCAGAILIRRHDLDSLAHLEPVHES